MGVMCFNPAQPIQYRRSSNRHLNYHDLPDLYPSRPPGDLLLNVLKCPPWLASQRQARDFFCGAFGFFWRNKGCPSLTPGVKQRSSGSRNRS